MERINAWLVNRLPSRRSAIDVAPSDTGLRVHERGNGMQSIAWGDINEILAARSDQMIGNTLLLLISLNDGRTLTVPEDVPVWQELAVALPKYLPGAKPYEQWAPQAAFSDEQNHVLVFRR